MISLFVGGSRSGKSVLAERRATALGGAVTYVATYAPEGRPDADMTRRIAAHRARRPSEWNLEEISRGGDLSSCMRRVQGVALIDALGTWVGGSAGFVVDIDAFCAAVLDRSGDTVIVSDEVGMGVHPSSPEGRHFRDVMGQVNAAVSHAADEAWLVVAGRVVPLVDPPWAS
ncbi:MAG: bifunctional adenosylcobinamide kinase/adenosylcobinamide-phosphate guanylyltransferase [Acidimicrobiales bacterium]